MKKIILILVLTLFSVAGFSQVLNNSQIINGNHWIYDSFNSLSLESGISNFTSNRPVTVGQLKMHFKEYDRESLSDGAKAIYDRAEEFLFTQKNLFPSKFFQAGFGLTLAPELCYKSNENIDWTYNYYYKNNPFSADIDVGVSDYFSMGGNYFLGKNWYYSHQSDNLTNIPLGFDQYEFMFPRFAYSSFAYSTDNWGININTGKEGLTIGNTFTGSIIYNKSFETEGYVQLTAYTDDLKYTMNVAEISPEKFLYWHQIDVRLFKKIKLGAMEGALVNRPFELRFLSPMVVYHSFAFWKNYTNDIEDHYYNEGYCCSYLGLTFEVNPVKYLRIYGLYAMNEIQLPNEHYGQWLSYPDSLGGQIGAELKLPSDFGGFWHGGLEAIYCSPFLYVKQAPGWSLYRARPDNVKWNTVNSWIGSPFGPDTFAVNALVGYEQSQKWSCSLGYLLCMKGENGFGMFEEEKNYEEHICYERDENGNVKKDEKNNPIIKYQGKVWTYYPYTQYIIAKDDNNEDGKNSAIEKARNMWISGICEYNNQVILEGFYRFNKKLKLQGQFIFNFVFNAKHIESNFQKGIQTSVALEYKVF